MKYLFFLIFLFMVSNTSAQDVKNTSYVTTQGEKVLRLEVVLPLGINEVWQLFTTDDGLQRWIAPVAHIELKTGGYIITNYDKTKSFSDSSSIKLKIVNYLEKELITLKVRLNDHFPKVVQNEDHNLQEIIQFISVGPNMTKIISSMIGWGKGDNWDNTYNFFEKGNIYTYEELINSLRKN